MGGDVTGAIGPTGLEWATDDLLARRAATTPERTGLIDADEGRRYSYGVLDRAVDVLLERLPGEPGDRLGVVLTTRPAFVTLLFAAMRGQRTLVLLNVRETAEELRSKADRADVSVLLCEDDTEGLAREIGDGSVPIYTVDGTQGGNSSPLASLASLVSLEPNADRDPSLESSTEGAPTPESESDTEGETNRTPELADTGRHSGGKELLVAFTSGTTGEPKGVRLTAENLVSSATASAFRLGVDPDDRWLCCLPMYHVGGLAPVFRSALYGTAVVLQREFDPDTTARTMESHDVTGVSLVPTMLSRLLEAGWRPPASLRFVLLGGAPASPNLIDRCGQRGVPACPTYGMTETASQIATATPEEAIAHEGTVGRPLVCTEVAILDDDGDPVETGETGEIVVSGPTVTPGYLEPERTRAAFDERGLRTGDRGRRDQDGRLWILDRQSDRIVTGGENVDPTAVAAVLEDHPAVSAAAVVGLSDEEWGERVGALVVASSREEIDPHEVRAYCRDRLAGFKCPKTIGIASSLPRTHSGTVDREQVRARLEEAGVDVSGDR
ncbi:class I adenylate-forming enzyme family protein [Natronosalvus halobius]|uniref:class I adenylate-forming enzyme family protein n=1 Tax=Natronosalvus halobius TaxID=2953746 RepID=UPI00209CA07C|nr:class I adenylate-forming enzyme family protein [Natronosalvus halobius]USZ72875.1 acyl--CoA ligase [Natronosalvus halobius]